MAKVRSVQGGSNTVVYNTQPTAISSKALGASGTLAFIETNKDNRRVVGFVKADQAGTLSFLGSVDGVNFILLATATIVAANTVVTFDQVLYAPVIKILYTNGGIAQTSFTFTYSTYPI